VSRAWNPIDGGTHAMVRERRISRRATWTIWRKQDGPRLGTTMPRVLR
jgi:hypothetical protein